MTETLHPHSQLIDAIGRSEIIAKLEASRQLVHVWRKRGIPSRHWVAIRDMAIERDVPVSFEALARGLAA